MSTITTITVQTPHIYTEVFEIFLSICVCERYWNKLLSKCAWINFWELNIIIFRLLLAWEKEKTGYWQMQQFYNCFSKNFKKYFYFKIFYHTKFWLKYGFFFIITWSLFCQVIYAFLVFKNPYWATVNITEWSLAIHLECWY